MDGFEGERTNIVYYARSELSYTITFVVVNEQVH